MPLNENWKKRRRERQLIRLERKLKEAVAAEAIDQDEADAMLEEARSLGWLAIAMLVVEIVQLILERLRARREGD